MASKIKVDQIEGQSGTSVEVPTGHTFKVTDLGNNKILSTNSSGIVTAVAMGSTDEVLKMTGTNTLGFGTAGGGKMLQVVQNTTSTNYTTTSSSFVYVSGMPQLNITPSATTSKILLLAHTGGCEMTGGNGYFTIARDGTNLGSSSGFTNVQHASNRREFGGSFNFLDEPSSTSQLTNNIQMRNSTGSQMSFSESSKTCLIAIEVGA